MGLSGDDYKWLKDEFDGVKEECRSALREHEARFHPPGRPLKTLATLLGIGAAGATLIGALLAALLWFIRHA